LRRRREGRTRKVVVDDLAVCFGAAEEGKNEVG